MSTQVLIQSASNKLGFVSLPRISLRKICLTGFILITSLLIFYIFQISEITENSFLISRQEQEIVKLSRQNKNLEISLSRENSLVNLEVLLKQLNYERVNKVYYIKAMDSGVAAKP